MYERFTDRARKAMQLANQEAQRFNHEYIGTEHILLGIMKEGSGVAANVLKNLNVDLRTIRLEVEKVIKPGEAQIVMGRLPHTPGAKHVVTSAINEARDLNHNYVGTEHLLLGLLHDPESAAGKVLTAIGLTSEAVRKGVLELLAGEKRPDGLDEDVHLLRHVWGKLITLPSGTTYIPAVRRFALMMTVDHKTITLEADTIEGLMELKKVVEAENETADTPAVVEKPNDR